MKMCYNVIKSEGLMNETEGEKTVLIKRQKRMANNNWAILKEKKRSNVQLRYTDITLGVVKIMFSYLDS